MKKPEGFQEAQRDLFVVAITHSLDSLVGPEGGSTPDERMKGIETFSLSRQAAWLVFWDTIGCVDTPTQDILTRTRVKWIKKSFPAFGFAEKSDGQFLNRQKHRLTFAIWNTPGINNFLFSRRLFYLISYLPSRRTITLRRTNYFNSKYYGYDTI